MDNDGVRLPLSDHFTARVPVITGSVSEFEAAFFYNKNALTSVFNVVKAARADHFLSAWLEGVHVQSNHDLILTGNVGKFNVLFGKSENIGEKFENLKIFLKKGVKTRGWNQIQSINLKYKGQVVMKLRAQA